MESDKIGGLPRKNAKDFCTLEGDTSYTAYGTRANAYHMRRSRCFYTELKQKYRHANPASGFEQNSNYL